MKTSIYYLVILFISSTFTISNAQEVNLKLNLKKDDTFYLENVVKQNITQQMMGQEMKIEQNITYGYEFHVTEVLPNNDYKIKMTYEKIGYKQDSQFSSVNYDSEDPNAEITPQTQSFAALKGMSFTIICDTKGNVSDIDGVNAIVDKLLSYYDDIFNEAQKADLREKLKKQYGDEAMKSTLANTMNIFPDGPVTTGAEWSRKISLDMGMAMLVDNTWKLNAIEGNKAKIGINSTIVSQPSENPMKVQGMELTYDMKGTQTGDMVLNITSGLTEKATITQNIDGIMLMSGNTLPEPMEVPMKIESTITIIMMER